MVEHYTAPARSIDAVQWQSPGQAVAIAEWCGGHYDRHTSGEIGPAGEDWGELEIPAR